MAQLVSVYYSAEGVHTYDGTNYKTFKFPENLLNVSTTYASIQSWVDDAVAEVAAHDKVVVGTDHDTTLEEVPAGTFKGFVELSAAGCLKLFQATLNKAVADGAILALTLPDRNTKYYCLVCDKISPSPNANLVGGINRNFIMSVCGHHVPEVDQTLYAMHKTLTTART